MLFRYDMLARLLIFDITLFMITLFIAVAIIFDGACRWRFYDSFLRRKSATGRRYARAARKDDDKRAHAA